MPSKVRNTRGAALVEFAFVIVMLMTILLGFMQLVFWFYGILLGDRAVADVQSSFANSIDINHAVEDTISNGRIITQVLIEPQSLSIDLVDIGQVLEYDFNPATSEWDQISGPTAGTLDCETTVVRINYEYELDPFIMPGATQTRQATTAFTCLQ